MPYDEPGYYDTTIRGNEHALCDHENGDCDVMEEDECDPAAGFCVYDNDDCEACAEYWLDFHADGMRERYELDQDDYGRYGSEDAAMESGLFGDC
jgi:hypothetical protein